MSDLLDKLKARRSSMSVSNAQKNLDKLGKKTYDKDERFWYPKRDDEDNTSCIIRFLPASDKSEQDFLPFFQHNFKGIGGKTLFTTCPTSIGEDCPVCAHNGQRIDWDHATEAEKNEVRPRLRNKKFVANVLVIKDQENPENNGKVFVFQFGPFIMKLLQGAMKPQFADSVAINPFNPWEGADFEFRVYRDDKMLSYDKSKFALPSAIGTDEEIAEVWGQQHHLETVMDLETKVLAYDDLSNYFERIFGEKPPTKDGTVEEKAEDDIPASNEKRETPPEPETTEAPPPPAKTETADDANESDDDIEEQMKKYREMLAASED